MYLPWPEITARLTNGSRCSVYDQGIPDALARKLEQSSESDRAQGLPEQGD
jgi:hypothetical protein